MRTRVSRTVISLTALAALVVGSLAAVQLSDGGEVVAGECAPGFTVVPELLTEVRQEMAAEGEAEHRAEEAKAEHESTEGERERDREFVREVRKELPVLQGVPEEKWGETCVRNKRPESMKELLALFGARAIPRMAPYGQWADGAARSAANERKAMSAGSVPGSAGTGALYGQGPLIVDDPRYGEVNGLGLHDNSGRVDSYAWDAANKRLFAAVGNGGIWRSNDLGATWTNANGNLPTSVTGAVAWSTANGGTLLALTGEPTFGAAAFTGVGAYYSTDLGATWTRASGVPDAGLGFALAVDPGNPARVYAATQQGLFVSTDGGKTYNNANLPTGPCAGKTDLSAYPKCALANVVTDVVVAKGGGVGTTTKAGTVVATVGWRGGNKTNPDGSVQSPANGVYRSVTGAPGSFTKLAADGFAPQDRIGRVELGNAVGAAQDHDLLYALVQDAKLLNNGGVAGIDVPEGTNPGLGTTVLNGLYVSTDFGATWKELASGTFLATDPASASALFGTGTALGYQPGVQGWYNQWVQPDPTRQTATGVPTRLAFGLEEVWANEAPTTTLPLDGSVPVHFRVVGKYFGGDSCMLLSLGLPSCPGDRETDDDNTTTHPDQQDGIWIADPAVPGGVQLVVGNDGGSYRYRFESDDDGELDNSHWGDGDQNGYSTLMPYYAAMAKDGTVYAGLQDNGTLRIDPTSREQFEVYGGDGFFTAVDPNNSDIAYQEYVGGAISVTTDGGKNWKSMDPGLTAAKFSNPFSLDPTDPNHLITAGREVKETLVGPETDANNLAILVDTGQPDPEAVNPWTTSYDLGTRQHPGDASATASATDPANSMSAIDNVGDASYVAFCGQCDTLNKLAPDNHVFQNGLATNVGGDKPAKKGSADGWHIVAATGLPNRYISSLQIDPRNPKNVFVTLSGYTRRWVPPGAVGDANEQLGTGHVYRSTDGGNSFVDISGNLPDSPANWLELRGDQLLVGTDVGAFASQTGGAYANKAKFAPLSNLPAGPVSSITLKPGDANTAVVAIFGRGVWTYTFDNKITLPDPTPAPYTLPAIGTAVASYDFEAGASGWTAQGAPTTWALASPGRGADNADAAAGQAWAISGPTAYVDNMDSTLSSPPVTVPAGKGLFEFRSRLDTEGGYDGISAEFSTDNGATWQPAERLGLVSGKNPDNPAWSRYGFEFTSTGGPTLFRLHFTSDSLCSGLGGPICESTEGWEGAHVDDVVVGVPTA